MLASFFVLIYFIGINSISDEECLKIAQNCYNMKSLETCHLNNLPEGCHCCYNKFYLNNEPMENCVVASGVFYQQYYNLKPGDIISDNGITYKSISNTCSKYYNTGNQKESRNTTRNTTNSTKNSSIKYSLSVVYLLFYICLIY